MEETEYIEIINCINGLNIPKEIKDYLISKYDSIYNELKINKSVNKMKSKRLIKFEGTIDTISKAIGEI